MSENINLRASLLIEEGVDLDGWQGMGRVIEEMAARCWRLRVATDGELYSAWFFRSGNTNRRTGTTLPHAVRRAAMAALSLIDQLEGK